MDPVLQPVQIVQEIQSCALLGVATGLVRGWFPNRGKAAFLPDLLWVGAGLLAAQSYAVGYSFAGQLRWYMVVALFIGAFFSEFVLGSSLRAAGRAIAALLAVPASFLRRCGSKCRRIIRRQNARRNTTKRNAEKSKKSLPNQRAVLYNSNVSK